MSNIAKTVRRVIGTSSGETMVETLVSILVSSLALLMLATAIGTAVNIVRTSKANMQQLYADESVMVQSTTGSGTPTDLKSDVRITQDWQTDLSGEFKTSVNAYELGESGDSGILLYVR